MNVRILIAATALILLVAAPAVAGTIFDMTVEYDSGKKTEQMRMTIEGSRLRMDTQMTEGQPSMSMIFRGDRDEMIVLDHSKSEAMVIDKATVEKMAVQMKQAQEQMEQMMANVPPAQREMMEKMMKDRMQGMMAEPPTPADVRKTSETGTTNGYEWVKYDVLQDDQKIREYLVTDWSNLKTDASTFDVFKEMAEFFESVTQSLGSSMPIAAQNPFDEANKLGGFPVITQEFRGGAVESRTELTAVTTGDVADDLFENPGYKVKKITPPKMR
jgi:hypothetical protein